MVGGIDYGSKLAGTTVLALASEEGGAISLFYSEKKKNADAFLAKHLCAQPLHLVCIDAPLSLPKIYHQPPQERIKQNNADFFFRACDHALQAMSPLFLGGLTARAMQLAHQLHPLPFHETYPARQAKRLGLLTLGYKKKQEYLPGAQAALEKVMPAWTIPPLLSWHAFDAVLALLGALRLVQGKHETYGDEEEGIILI